MNFTKAQGAIEFVAIFGAVLFFSILFFNSIQIQSSQKNAEKERVVLQSVALGVKEEIDIASGALDGYTREFTIPKKILGKEYEIIITDGFVYASTKEQGAAYRVVNVTGQISLGNNTIKKENGTVYLN